MDRHPAPTITYIGGPTALIEWRGLRILTDPTFDPAGSRYETPIYTLRKTQEPALRAGGYRRRERRAPEPRPPLRQPRSRRPCAPCRRAARADDDRGRRASRTGSPRPRAVGVNRTRRARRQPGDRHRHAGAARPGGRGPRPCHRLRAGVSRRAARCLHIGRHGLVRRRRGSRPPLPRVDRVLFLGAALQAVGRAPDVHRRRSRRRRPGLSGAAILPLHFEGWEHFSESRTEVVDAFAGAGLSERLRWLTPGQAEPLIATGP